MPVSTEQKQSYNYLIPNAGAAPRLERLRLGDAESGLGAGLLGQEPRGAGSGRVGAASGRGRSGADPADPFDLGGFGVRRSRASLYVAGQRCRDAGDSEPRPWRCSASGTNSVSRLWRACVRSRRGRPAAQGELLAIDERIGLQRNAIAALLGAGPDRGLAITRPTAQFAGIPGVAAEPGVGAPRAATRHHRGSVSYRSRRPAHRSGQGGLLPERKPARHSSGLQSLGIDNLAKSGSGVGSIGPAISLPIFNTERLQGQLRGAHAEYEASVATYNATLSEALRGGGRRRDQPQVAGWGARRVAGSSRGGRGSTSDSQPTL